AHGLTVVWGDDGAVWHGAFVDQLQGQAHAVVAERLIGASHLSETRGDALSKGNVVTLLVVPVIGENTDGLTLEVHRCVLAETEVLEVVVPDLVAELGAEHRDSDVGRILDDAGQGPLAIAPADSVTHERAFRCLPLGRYRQPGVRRRRALVDEHGC